MTNLFFVDDISSCLTKADETMSMITKQDIMDLSKVQNERCVSIFIPTHRVGEETLKGTDAINLKNHVKVIKKNLKEEGLDEREIDKFLNPITELINDSSFWRHQKEGLAVFLSDGFFKKYILPFTVDEYTYISKEFYLKPLIPLFNTEESFHILTLKLDEVKFYEADKFSITEKDINDLVPSRLEDTVGYDYEQKSFQFRSEQGRKSEGMFHGHGDNEGDTKSEVFRFFREIDKGLSPILNQNSKAPLVICCQDHYCPIYKEANTYSNLYPQHLRSNPADLSDQELHKKASELLEPFFNKGRTARIERYLDSLSTSKTSNSIEEILPATLAGRVDALFINKDSDLFGTYDAARDKVSFKNVNSVPTTSLTNFAAIKVFEQGGKVYISEPDDMPDKSSEISALFRY